SRPMTLVVAPAGSGKTQLLSHWVAHHPRPTTWLSLEEMDDDPIGLWTAVIAALQTLAPGAGRTATGLMARRAPLTDVVVAVLDDIDVAEADESVLVLDDIHHLKDPATTESLALFV